MLAVLFRKIVQNYACNDESCQKIMLAQSIKAYTRYDKKLWYRIKSKATLPALGVNQEWQGSSELDLDGLFNFKTGSTRENEDISLRATSQQMRYWNKKFYTRCLSVFFFFSKLLKYSARFELYILLKWYRGNTWPQQSWV